MIPPQALFRKKSPPEVIKKAFFRTTVSQNSYICKRKENGRVCEPSEF